MSRRRQFLEHMGKTVGSSSVQLLITLVTTPLMTRLFTPEAYAVFGLVTAAAAVMVGIGMLSLPTAYTAEKDVAKRNDMLHAMLQLLTLTTLVATVIALLIAGARAYIPTLHVPLVALLFLPILVASYGVRQIVQNIGIQRGVFGQLSKAQILEPLTSRGGSVLLGAAVGGAPLLVLLSIVAGHGVAVRTLLRSIPTEAYQHWQAFHRHWGQLRVVMRRMGDFVVFGTASSQAQQLMILAIQVGIAGFVSGHLAGQYIFATSILSLPVSVIALASAPVIYHHLMETEKSHPAQLTRHFLGALALYGVGAVCIYVPISLFGEPLFALIFGAIWRQAGAISASLSLAYGAVFVLTGVQCIFMVTRRLRTQWYGEIATAIPAMMAGVYCFKMMDFTRALFYLSWIWLARSILLLALCVRASLSHKATQPSLSYE